MQSLRHGSQRLFRGSLRAYPANGPTPALRIGGNQRLPTSSFVPGRLARPIPSYAFSTIRRSFPNSGSNAFERYASPSTKQPRLRSEFSTLGNLKAKAKPFSQPSEEDVKLEKAGETEQGRPDEGKEGKESKNDEEKEEDKKEGKKDEKEGKEDPPPPPPPHGDKSPFAVFMETLQSEFKKSQEWQDSTKQLAASANTFTESPAVRKAREAYGAGADVAGKVGGKTAEALGKTASAVGKGAAWTWNTPVVKVTRKVARATGEGVASVTKPVRDTKVYKDVTGNIKEVIDDGSSSRYGGYLEREERKRQREIREKKEEGKEKVKRVAENPDAGENVVLHKDAKWKESWREFRDNNKMLQNLFQVRRSLEESDNPLVNAGRSIADRFAGFFAENETAMVIRKMREIDPNFQLEPFLRELREYILPEVLEAYVKGDVSTLKSWLSAAQYNVYAALAEQYTKNGLKLDGKILDIRNVDVVTAKMLDPGDIPVFIVSARTQEVHVYRDIKTGELKAGMQDRVQQVTYVIGITRLADEVANAETNGWRLLEMQKSARNFM